MKSLKNIVISLKNSDKRRAHVTKQFSEKNINFDFFDAIDETTLYNATKQIGFTDSQMVFERSNLTNGEIGCFLSHLSVLKICVDNDLDYVAIYEDDVHLAYQAELYLTSSDWIPSDINFIKLETFHKTKIGRKNIELSVNGRSKLYRLYAPHVGTCGYIVSKKVAKDILEKIIKLPNPFQYPIDILIFERLLNTADNLFIYQMSPALTIQDMLLQDNSYLISTLDNEQRLRQTKKSLPAYLKVKREMIRIFGQFLDLINNIQSAKISFYKTKNEKVFF